MPRRDRPRSWFGLRASHLPNPNHPIVRNFFADRCTHLAAMVAYYALLSLLPFLFLTLSLLGLTGQQTDSSFLIRQLGQALPGQPLSDLVALVNELRGNAASFGVAGAVGIIWSSLGLLSAVESALNIIYEVPNRAFLKQKLLVFGLIAVSLLALFGSLTVTTALWAWARPYTPEVLGVVNVEVALSVLFSAVVSTTFLFACYRYLPNTPVTTREALPGVVFGAILFQASFQALPLYLRYVEVLPALKAFGGVVVLLVWLFLMANILLLGAEINFWYGRGRTAPEPTGVGLA